MRLFCSTDERSILVSSLSSLLFLLISLQHTERVDFSFNPLADPRFIFHDHALVEAVKLENPEVHAFFRLLALCHTVMAEEKKEGEETFTTYKKQTLGGHLVIFVVCRVCTASSNV